MSDEVVQKKRRNKGEGGIRKPKDSPNWSISYYGRDGRQTTESSRSPVKAVAIALLQERIAQVKAGVQEPSRADRITLKELLDDVVLDYRSKNQATTDEAAGRSKLHLLPFFGETTRALSVRNPECQKYILHRIEQGAAASTVCNELQLLRRAFRLGVINGKIPVAPHVSLPSVGDNSRQGFLEREEYKKLMECLPQNLKPVVSLAFHSGMRRGEILNLRWKDLDLAEGFIHLEAAATKTRRARRIPLAAEPLAYLRAQKVRRDATDPSCDYVFFRRRQNGTLVQLADFRDAWETACEEAGLDGLLFHDLRRSAIRQLVRAGVSEGVVMSISGHRTRRVFDAYNLSSETDQREAVKKLDAHLSQPAPEQEQPQQVAAVPQLLN